MKIKPAHTLWYAAPASDWNAALPLGNGRIGAMVFGGVEKERLALNEDTLWTGRPSFCECPTGPETWQEAKKLVRGGEYLAAQKLLERDFTGNCSQNYLPLGDLILEFGARSGTCYRRVLSLDTGVHTVEFLSEDVMYRRETLVSFPDGILAEHLTASQPGKITCTLSLDCQLRHTVTAAGKTLTLRGQAPVNKMPRGEAQEKTGLIYPDDPEAQGMKFGAQVRAEAVGGTVMSADGKLRISGADEVTVYFAAHTSFRDWKSAPDAPFEALCRHETEKAAAKGWKAVLEEHLADHRALYDRCELTLPGGAEGELPTDERLRRHAEGESDPTLYALLFHYGRYLTIAGSRPGTQATNLQGIWNPHLLPPWNANYTININTEMNYWPTMMVNLAECHEPLNRLVTELCESGRRTAKAWYGAGGAVAHHNTDLWRISSPMGNGREGCCVWSNWPMSLGWLSRNLVEYYRYTGDKAFLRDSLLPLLRDVAQFYENMVDEDKDGRLVFAPSTSPENHHLMPEGQPDNPLGETTAMTMAIIRDVFREVTEGARTLGEWTDVEKTAEEMLPRLKGFELTDTGAIAEWAPKELHTSDEHHRHISHLYGMHPGHEIQPGTPMAEAVRQSLKERGDDGTGWSLGWKINQWARLRDGDHALRLVDLQLRPVSTGDTIYICGGGSYPNLLDAHPPFQIDGNFGAAAGIGEMLVQNTPEGVVLLPALPGAWKSGSVRGMRIWGGKTVDIAWEDGKVTESRIY